MHRYCFLFLILFLNSCGQIEFSYKDNINITNPIYKKTSVSLSGKELFSTFKYISKYVGESNNPDYHLEIYTEEKSTKRSVQTNQAVSQLDFQLELVYTLKRIDSDCLLYKDTIFSRFSYTPKSEGYNFGSDESLLKMYDLASRENTGQFIQSISGASLESCINEN